MQGTPEGNYKLKALKITAVAIFSVVIVEVSIGLIVNSLAILSDGLHCLLDAISTIMLFFAVRASMQPPDEEHTYGHEKFEDIGGLIGGVTLIAVAFLIFYEAGMRIIEGSRISHRCGIRGFYRHRLRHIYRSAESYSFQKKPAYRKPLYASGTLRCNFRFKFDLACFVRFRVSYIGLLLWRLHSINSTWCLA